MPLTTIDTTGYVSQAPWWADPSKPDGKPYLEALYYYPCYLKCLVLQDIN
jgi:hypothetical protein